MPLCPQFIDSTSTRSQPALIKADLPPNPMYVGVHRLGEVKVNDVGDVLEVHSSRDAVLLIPGNAQWIRSETNKPAVPAKRRDLELEAHNKQINTTRKLTLSLLFSVASSLPSPSSNRRLVRASLAPTAYVRPRR